MVIKRKKGFNVHGWIVVLKKKRTKALNVYEYKGIRRVVMSDRNSACVFSDSGTVRWAVHEYINGHKTQLTLDDFEAIKVRRTVTISERIEQKDWQKTDRDGRPVDDRDPLLVYNEWPAVVFDGEDLQEVPMQPLMHMDIF